MRIFKQLSLPIIWHTRQRCDVVIFDEVGSNELRMCIPPDLVINVLNVRQGRPLIKSVNFFLKIILNLFIYKKISVAQYVAILNVWTPKILITYIDNSVVPGILKEKFPGLLVISVQNGFRGDFAQKNLPNKFGYYFSFGDMEFDLFQRQKYSFDKFIPVGSLRANIAHERYGKDLSFLPFDICFISEFVSNAELLVPDSWSLELLTMINKEERPLFKLVAKYAKENQLKLCVAMRNSEGCNFFNDEWNFFKTNSKGMKATIIPRKDLSSYKMVLNSRLSVCLFSTLGYEALGLGKKIIFASDNKKIADFWTKDMWDINYPVHKLPNSLRLYDMDYSEFSSKASKLLEMTDEQFLEHTIIARKYYMNLDLNNPPQNIIKYEIEKFLKK